MSDIFVSYAAEDRSRVKELAQSLEAQGWSVWWDRSIPFGKRFHQVIEEELAQARSVMVVWSASSVRSDWVRAEAGEGMARGVLVPVAIEDVSPPLVFRQIQTADLSRWEGDAESPVFRKLMADLAALLGAPPAPTVEPIEREPEVLDEEEAVSGQDEGEPPGRRGEGRPQRRWPLLAAVGALAAVVLALLVWRWLAPGARPPDRPEVLGVDGGRSTAPRPEVREVEAGPPSVPPVEEPESSRPPPPEILSFTADPDRVPPGGRTELRWRTRHAERVEVDGHPVPPTGAREVPPLERDALFVLTAAGAEGEEARREVRVTVEAVAGPAPGVDYFVARPTRIEAGGRANLLWSTENSEFVEIEGLGRFEPKGETSVRPDETTVYRLTARAGDGRGVTAQAEIEVERAAGIGPRFSGPVELREGLTVDLDSGDVSGSKVSQKADLVLAESSRTRPALLTPLNGAAFAVVRDHAHCSRVKPVPDRVPVEELPRGSYLCVRTNEGRLSVCGIRTRTAGVRSSVLGLTCVTDE